MACSTTFKNKIAVTRARLGLAFFKPLIPHKQSSRNPKCLVVLTTEHIVQECPEHQYILNSLSIPDNLDEALNQRFLYIYSP